MDSPLHIDQVEYAHNVCKMESTSGFAVLRRLRHKLAWLALTCPNILVAVNVLAQVNECTY